MAKFKMTEEDVRKVTDIEILSESNVEKQDLKTIRVDLTWSGTDLDICAFMLGPDGVLEKKQDLVYFKSECRWKPKKPFNDPDFDPLDGSPSNWKDEQVNYRGRILRWMGDTLPASTDYSVIGSWDDMADDPNAECGETMHVQIEEVNTIEFKKIVIAAVVAEAQIKLGETFNDVQDAKVIVTDVDSGDVLVEFKIAARFPDKDALCFAELEYDETNYMWHFKPLADAYKGGILYLANNVF